MTMATLEQWQRDVVGRALDVDRSFGAQCWDLWSHYAQHVVGVPYALTVTRAGAVAPHPGWACNVFHNAGEAGLGRWFHHLMPKGTTARAGDVAFWEKSPTWPGSHVAIVLADDGDRLLTITQNPGPPAVRYLPKTSLLGYLRPKAGKASTPATPRPQEDDVALTQRQADALEHTYIRRKADDESRWIIRQIWEQMGGASAKLDELQAGIDELQAEGAADVDADALGDRIVAALPADLADRVAQRVLQRIAAGAEAEA